MARFNARLITPPREEEEVYPYRRVWRSIVIETGAVFGVAAVLYVLLAILHLGLPQILVQPTNVVLALLPLLLWLVFSWWSEHLVREPRRGLLLTLVVGALTANAVGIPLINGFLQIDRWLPLSSAVNRIAGYTLTVGIVQETLKYLVVRYLAWPDRFRTRWDGIAYGAACAVGYATVANLHFVLDTPPLPYIAAARVFDTLVLHLVASSIVSYGLSELRFNNPTPLLLPTTLALAAFITGVAVPVRAGLVNATLSLDVSSTRLIFGLGFSLALLVAIMGTLAFLLNAAERYAREIEVREV